MLTTGGIGGDFYVRDGSGIPSSRASGIGVAISDDGNKVLAIELGGAFRSLKIWESPAVVTDLSTTANVAGGVLSGDGRVAYCDVGFQVVRWEEPGMVSSFPTSSLSALRATNVDGSIAVGGYFQPGSPDAAPFRVDSVNGVVDLPMLPGSVSGLAVGISDDGELIVD